MEKDRVIVICGPTGIGKTELSIRLAERFGGEIVGADSMQVYRYMDIGTAKPTRQQQKRVPHHMIDAVDPGQPYDAARYLREARASIRAVAGRGRVPMVVGGTGFYIKALLYGLFQTRPKDEQLRRRLRLEAETLGGGALYERLARCDPQAASRIHPNDTYRVIRALEVFEATGRPVSAWREAHRFSDAPFDALKFALYTEREELYRRIDQRVDAMIREGLVDEVRRLLEMGYPQSLRPMQALGYRHVLAYLSGTTDWQSAVRSLKRDTRRYAKRQLTWLRSDPEMIWIRPEQEAEIGDRILAFLSG